jgi:hypothetical protein
MTPEQIEDAELQRLDLERQRFKLERQSLVFRYVAILGAIVTFGWTAFTYFDNAYRERQRQSEEQAKTTAVQKVAAMQPFLERQLRLFEDTTQTVGFLATSLDSAERGKKLERFWQLYWGELALVEHGKVESAMVAFGDALTSGADQRELQQLALEVTYACRDELAESWGEPSWKRER